MSLKKFIIDVRQLSKRSSIPHYINGNIFNANGAEPSKIMSPYNNKSVGNIILNDKDALTKTISNSQLAYRREYNNSINERIEVLQNWNNWLIENKDELAGLISDENGKPLDDAKAEIDRGLEVVRYAFSAPTLLKGDYSIINKNLEIYTKKQPLGVTLGILPFNFPAMIPLWMIPLAVVTGNSIILKSSEKCPYTPLCLAYGATQSGIPDGLINVVHGNQDITNSLISHNDIKAVSFVGSTNVGKQVYDIASKNGKRTQINMGAKNHAVIMPDAEVEHTVNSIISGFVMGQRCMAISTLIVVNGGESIINKIVDKLRTIDPIRDMGPLINVSSKTNIINNIEASVELGAKLIYGDYSSNINDGVGNYLEPIVIDNVTTHMPVYKNELFGPVLSIIRVANIDDAIEIVNNNEYGNGTAIFTNNNNHSTYYENNVNVTQCGINVPIPVSPPYYSWTSNKESYRGSHYIYGPSSFNFYTQERTIIKNYNSNSKLSTSMPTN